MKDWRVRVSHAGFAGHGKEFEFYSKCKRKSLEHFEEEADLIYIIKVLF